MSYCDIHRQTYAGDECRLCARARRAEALRAQELKKQQPPADDGAAAIDGEVALAARLTDVGREADGKAAQPVGGGGYTVKDAPADQEGGDTPATPKKGQDVPAATLQKLIDKKSNVAMIIGFPGAGKSWFLDRLKFQLFQHSETAYACRPPHVGQNKEVERSEHLTLHYFTPVESDSGAEAFYLLDIPGERFINLAEGSLSQRSLELLALKAARALIIVLPAADVLMGARANALHPQAESKPDLTLSAAKKKSRSRRARIDDLDRRARQMAADEQFLERFTANMAHLRAVLSLLEGGADIASVATLTEEDVIAHLDSKAYKTPSKPVFVALSKSDVVERHVTEWTSDRATRGLIGRLFSPTDDAVHYLRNFDWDPEETVGQFRRPLVRIMSGFRWCKFDFLTAFRAHVDEGEGATKVNYTLEHYGVSAVIRWLEWARRSDMALTRKDWRYVRVARAIRRFRQEGRFTRRRRGEDFQ